MVSIIIPVYNTPFALLDRCIRSVEKSGLNDYEIIIVDDGSDNKIDDKYISDLSCEARYYYQKNNGVSSARNKGIEEAKGDYIMFVDSDDEIVEGSLDDYYFVDDYDLILFDLELVKNETITRYTFGCENDGASKDDYIEKMICESVLGGPVSRAYKKNLIDSFDICFDENIYYGEDFFFNYCFLICEDNISIKEYDTVVYRYYWQPSSGVNRIKKLKEKVLKSIQYVVSHKNNYINNTFDGDRKRNLLLFLNEGMVNALFDFVGCAIEAKVFDGELKEYFNSIVIDIDQEYISSKKVKIKMIILKNKIYWPALAMVKIKSFKAD